MTRLIDNNTVDDLSQPFVIPLGGQVTVFAMGLVPGEYVEFELLRFTEPMNNGCECPPLAFVPFTPDLVSVLRNPTGPIRLSSARPYVILDAPQAIPLRARFNGPDPIVGQRVWFETTNTPNPTDYMRGYD